MGNTDSIPIISQAKSIVQVINGDAEGAIKTQENFSNQCVVVSQVKSLVQTINGDDRGAKETQGIFFENAGQTLNGITNGIPVVGHIKGTIHYICGDKDGGDQAMKSASRTAGFISGLVGGGVGGMIIGGVVGTISGGIAGVEAIDGINTGANQVVQHKLRPPGIVQSLTDIADRKDKKANQVFAQGFGLPMDYKGANKPGQKIQKPKVPRQAQKRTKREDQLIDKQVKAKEEKKESKKPKIEKKRVEKLNAKVPKSQGQNNQIKAELAQIKQVKTTTKTSKISKQNAILKEPVGMNFSQQINSFAANYGMMNAGDIVMRKDDLRGEPQDVIRNPQDDAGNSSGYQYDWLDNRRLQPPSQTGIQARVRVREFHEMMTNDQVQKIQEQSRQVCNNQWRNGGFQN